MKTFIGHLRFVALCLALSLAAVGHGQEGLESLALSDVFSGKVAQARIVSETHVEGSGLTKYQLTVFRSVQCTSSAQGFTRLERLLARDEASTTEKEVQRSNHRTQFALFRYKQKDGSNHYIIYQRRSPTDFTCVYLEGSASIQQLKQTFCK